jgi:hypothetical protein
MSATVKLIGGPHDGEAVTNVPAGALFIEVPGRYGSPPDRYRIGLSQCGEFVARYIEPDDAT